MPAMKRFWTYSAIGVLTFVPGVALYIHFTFGLNIVFADAPKLTHAPAPKHQRCMDGLRQIAGQTPE